MNGRRAPIIAGAVANTLRHVAQLGLSADQLMPFLVGIVSSGVVGYLSIAFLIRYLQTHNTFLFVYYRIALGIVVYLAIIGSLHRERVSTITRFLRDLRTTPQPCTITGR